MRRHLKRPEGSDRLFIPHRCTPSLDGDIPATAGVNKGRMSLEDLSRPSLLPSREKVACEAGRMKGFSELSKLRHPRACPEDPCVVGLPERAVCMGRRNKSDDDVRRGRRSPSSVSLRLPPSPARGEGSLVVQVAALNNPVPLSLVDFVYRAVLDDRDSDAPAGFHRGAKLVMDAPEAIRLSSPVRQAGQKLADVVWVFAEPSGQTLGLADV